MFAAHEAPTHLDHWQRYLPHEVTVPGRDQPVTRLALFRVIREELLPFLTYGPDCDDTVADYLTKTLLMFRQSRGEEFAHWLGETLRVATTARRAGPFPRDAVMVTATTWAISCTTGDGIDGAILNVHAVNDVARNEWGGLGVSVRHPAYDGLRFDSRQAAREFAWRAGLIERHVSRFAAEA